MDNNNLRNLSYIIGEDTEHKVYKMMSFVGENASCEKTMVYR